MEALVPACQGLSGDIIRNRLGTDHSIEIKNESSTFFFGSCCCFGCLIFNSLLYRSIDLEKDKDAASVTDATVKWKECSMLKTAL